MTEQQNTRPSASREIAVKPLKWYENGTRSIARAPDGHYWILDCYDGQWGLIERGKNGFTVGHDNACLFTGPEDARLGADILNRKRILENLCADTTPGNTDPIAKYDDELRKVQGGWRDMGSAPKDGRAVLLWWPHWWHDAHPGYYLHNQWHSDKALCSWSEGDEGGPTHWMPLPPPPTEHPTEQPSVRDAARVLLDHVNSARMKAAPLISMSDAMRLESQPPRFMAGLIAALRSLAQEGE